MSESGATSIRKEVNERPSPSSLTNWMERASTAGEREAVADLCVSSIHLPRARSLPFAGTRHKCSEPVWRLRSGCEGGQSELLDCICKHKTWMGFPRLRVSF
jgi:hypothetical protein